MAFKGKPPGSGSGEMSRRTQALRPDIALEPREAAKARALRRQGEAPAAIAARFGVPVEEVEKALVQMRSRRPESTRGTLNVTLAAHRFVLAERQGEEPLWQTMDRLVDELIRLRQAARPAAPRTRREAGRPDDLLPGLLPDPRPN
ncbi:hypothetical protein [Roseicella frigidaeris]|uniref:Uncharacterized protein n=1 Tax=Roseicella frigidaeris TaxID=2230885 RepID=A0A327MC59_9PROT|nr:hypothetical protein [Roseicella frigidaeris]RAI60821.1 hypothetical protein DOO78_01445 [Roseicella frigidaeris]